MGPAFLATLVLAAAYLWWRREQWAEQQRQPVIVEHQTAPPSEAVGAVPPDFVLTRADDLGLSPEQRQQVAPLAEEWKQATGGLQQRLDAAALALQRRLEGSASRRLNPGDYAAEASEMQRLSRELSERRKAYWRRLQLVLSAEQQQRAIDAWARAHRWEPTSPGRPAGEE